MPGEREGLRGGVDAAGLGQGVEEHAIEPQAARSPDQRRVVAGAIDGRAGVEVGNEVVGGFSTPTKNGAGSLETNG